MPEKIDDRFQKRFLLLLTIGITVVFLLMIRRFLVAILLAAIFSAMAQPLHRWFTRLVRGRKTIASVLTLVLVFLTIVGPLAAFITVVASQAVSVSQSVGPWVQGQLAGPGELDRLLERIPFYDHISGWIDPYRAQIISKAGEVAGNVGQFLVSRVADASRMTMSFLLNLFVMLYAMFFFLTGGGAILEKIMYYMPLNSDDENQMVGRFVSVTRATLKGTLVIGIIQGALAGVAFWVAGIKGPAFWGTVMAVLSIIPGIGAALVWVPAAIVLVATSRVVAALLLTLWCGIVVGTVDNLLRPRLVGKDAKLSDLLILLSTLGGIFLFGAMGVILGPIVAALFVTVWEIYGVAFKDVLPEVKPRTADEAAP